MWRVIHKNYYDDLFAYIEVGKFDDCTDDEAVAKCDFTTIILRKDHICVIRDGDEKIITDVEREMYSFEIIDKEDRPDPIDPRLLSEKEILDLLDNSAYMLEESDFRKVSWTITEAYNNLKSINPEKNEFILDSSAYRVEQTI
ncbi:hypothetical protein D3C74_91180 [compost metagenome]